MWWNVKRTVFALVAACALVSSARGVVAAEPPAAALPCPGVDQMLTADRSRALAALIASSLKTKISPTGIRISRFMESGSWSLVWARPPSAEEGVFFFEQTAGTPHFKTVWGGHATHAEKTDVARWARGQASNFPPVLAECFADAVTQGE